MTFAALRYGRGVDKSDGENMKEIDYRFFDKKRGYLGLSMASCIMAVSQFFDEDRRPTGGGIGGFLRFIWDKFGFMGVVAFWAILGVIAFIFFILEDKK
jgi:hypothetical protein